jgi:UDP-glucose:(heptosyl)LPS alpha-1,3-glucosyltransferase
VIRLTFPHAHRRGGAERVVWEYARWFGARGGAEFVGGEFEDTAMVPGLRHVRVEGLTSGTSARRVARAMTKASRHLEARPTISFGVVCPPAEVAMVQSVHRTWVMEGGTVRVRGVAVPGAVRRAMPRHRALLALERAYFTDRRVEALIAISSNVADDLVRWYDVDPERVRVIPNGFAPDEFNVARRDRERDLMRSKLGIGDQEVALLFVANELHRKGFGVLVRALGALRDDRLSLHVVGKAPLDPYQTEIEAAGLSDCVRYHGPTDDVGGFFAAADLFVLPTQYEAFGLVIVEALAMGVPVLTTAVAGASHAVVPGVNGLLQQDPRDVRELTDLIGQATSPEQLALLANGAPHSVDHLTWDNVLPAVQSLVGTMHGG